jgi:phenylpropionate dioxygenase-like ring-hydroxylating dioxygenase large terminal subunit
VPSEGDKQLKGRRCLKTFPCHEKEGVIWVWMGEGEPTPIEKIWSFPYYGERGWVSYIMVTDFNNEVTNLVENFMDVPHTVSVHKGWFRNEAVKKVPFVTETSGGQVLVTYNQPDDNIGVLIKPLLNPKGEAMVHTDCFVFPNITRVDYKFGSNSQYVINSQCTPVSAFKTRVYTYIGYKIPFVGPLIKPFIEYYTRQVIEQDVWIMDVQRANLTEEEEPRFQSTPADEPHLQIERLRALGIKGDSKVYEVKKRVEGEMWI